MIVQKKIVLLMLLIFFKISVYAQCAMCKATLESDLASGGTAGKGINDGIIYLMIFPYLLVGIVGYFVYKHYKKTKQTEQA